MLLSGTVVINEILYDPYIPPGGMTAAAGGAAVASTPVIQYRSTDYDPVSGTWTDSASLGGVQNATQATAASRPALVSNATPSGRPVVHFDGVNDFFNLPNLSSAFPQGAEVFVAIKAAKDPAVDGNSSGFWYMGSSGASNSHYPWVDGQLYDSFGTDTRNDRVGGAAAGALDQMNVYDVTSAPGEWTARLNNVVSSTRSVNTVVFPTNPKLGQSRDGYSFSGDIAEFRLYDLSAGPLTQAQRATVYAEMKQLYIPPVISVEFIELHNPGDAPVNLSGATFGAGVDYTFPANTVLPAGGYLVVADDPTATQVGYGITGVLGPWSGKLDNNGEQILLLDPGGNTLDDVRYESSFRWPAVGEGQSPPSIELIRPTLDNTVGGNWRATGSTPGRINNAYDPNPANGFTGGVADTHFDHDRGFYSSPFDVVVATDTPGATIAYTTDGSVPTLSNGVVTAASTVSVHITTTTILRAAAFKSTFQPSNVDTQTYVFPAAVGNQQRPPGVGTTWPGGYPADFDMSPGVINSTLPGYGLTDALTSIPSISIVMPPDDLWGQSNGIYANAGIEVEKASSIEMLLPGGGGGFQENAGTVVRGYSSESKSLTPKQSLTVTFRSEYGVKNLEYPGLFPGSADSEFNGLVLRGNVLDSWINNGTDFNGNVDGELRWYRERAAYIRDQWIRDAQIDMGQPSADGRFVNVYLNGSYWGIYNLDERHDEQWAAAHLDGGSKADYDVVHDAEVKAGNLSAWNDLMSLASTDLSNTANYQRLMGNNPDGTRNPNYSVLLDLDNLVDYMILHIYAGADDWAWHNWTAMRSRGPQSTGWKWLAWDQEISINSLVKQHTASGQLYAEVADGNTPAYVYSRLRANADFRQYFADRVQKLMFNGGPLSVQANIARWDARVAEIDKAIVGESARWGDFYRPDQPYKRENEWLADNTWMRNTFFPQNLNNALTRFKNANLYPVSLAAPTYSQFGGDVPSGYSLTIVNPSGVGSIWYTTDGSDPRLPGGSKSTTALAYSGQVTIAANTRVQARVLNGTSWSPLTDAVFTTGPSPLRITEIMYNPSDFGATYQPKDFEYIELQNTGTSTLNLKNMKFTLGVDFTFPDLVLAAGQYTLVVANQAAFQSRYGTGPSIAGVFSGSLANEGEEVKLLGALGETIHDFTYADVGPWPVAADGSGPSLVKIDPLGAPSTWGDGAAWRASTGSSGSPGASDGPPAVVGKFLFYNNSRFDGFNSAMNLADDNAIATDKQPLLLNHPATFANYSSYTGGINGIMIDISGLPVGPLSVANDFTFKIGNNNSPAGWSTLAATPAILVRRGEGTNHSDRIELTWPDGTIRNQWVQVTVLPTSRTGLASADVFHFGSAVGDTGNSTTATVVDAADYFAIRDHLRSYNDPAPITWRWDLNKDGVTDGMDLLLVRGSPTSPTNSALSMITPTAPLSSPTQKQQKVVPLVRRTSTVQASRGVARTWSVLGRPL